MRVLGIETSCDETGIAVYDSKHGLRAHALYSQVTMHDEYGGVVPELASRDHIRRVLPLTQQVLVESGLGLNDIDAIAYTRGPGLAGALLVGASIAAALGYALNKPALGIHHLEGHLLSPLLSRPTPEFPFVALLASGGHTQLMQVSGVGQYALLGETVDDAAGEAFDKSAKLLGLGYPGGPALSLLAQQGDTRRYKLPRPMLASSDLNFSFSGLKTAVRMLVNREPSGKQTQADIAAAVETAIVEVLVTKSLAALKHTGLKRLVVAGGVGANHSLREKLSAEAAHNKINVFYPEPELCTDNGAMIAFAGALRLQKEGFGSQDTGSRSFSVNPRWDLELPDVNAA